MSARVRACASVRAHARLYVSMQVSQSLTRKRDMTQHFLGGRNSRENASYNELQGVAEDMHNMSAWSNTEKDSFVCLTGALVSL